MTEALAASATPWRFLRFNAVGAAGMVVQLASLWLLVDVAHVHETTATALAVTTAVVHNFTWHRLWTWRDRATATPLVKTFAAFAVANGLVSLAGNVVITTALVTITPLHAVAANIVAIGACGVINYWLADAVVFVTPEGPPGRA